MIRLALLICSALMAGCTTRTLNTGAAGPWRVTMSNADQVQADFGGDKKGVIGFCDHRAHEIRLPFDRSRGVIAAVSMHELGHKIEREYPRIWVELDAMDTADFPCGSDDLHAARRAAQQATKDNQ